MSGAEEGRNTQDITRFTKSFRIILIILFEFFSRYITSSHLTEERELLLV